MSESQNERNDAAPDPETVRRPSDVPSANGDPLDRQATSSEGSDDQAGETIPGEQPEDNPDLEGEERFDAG